jgi:hypothetical protein
MAIGTLNEGALHAQLKDWYRQPDDRLEQRVGGYVIDLVRGDTLVEFQTGGFTPLRRKLQALTAEHPVRLVAPIAVTRRIVRMGDGGEILSMRRSPRRGRVEDVFARLVSFPALLCDPRFELEVLLTHQDELRVFGRARAYRRRGWTVAGRSLLGVEQTVLLGGAADAAALLPAGLPDAFDTAELAAAARMPRRLAQQMAYCLRAMGVIEPVGVRRRSTLHSFVT